jgi:diacylglycerol kinase (ATP)
MPAIVILNPYAGRWKGQQKRGEFEIALKEAGVDYKLAITERPGHGSELAARAVREGFSPVIAAGGDGSISEVVNGMLQGVENFDELKSTPLGVLPLGTANDFCVNLHMPLDIPSATKVIANGQTRSIDLGEVRFGSENQTRYFDNNSAIGLEPSVTLIQQRIKRLRGVMRYLVATLIGVYHNPQWIMQIEWEGGRFNGMANLVTVGINPLTGGLFYMTPHADPYDGLLTFVYGSVPTRMKILSILPKTMKPGPGSYVEHPTIHEINSPWVKIHSETPTPLHADGEIQSETVQDLEYRVLPACLPVLM